MGGSVTLLAKVQYCRTHGTRSTLTQLGYTEGEGGEARDLNVG